MEEQVDGMETIWHDAGNPAEESAGKRGSDATGIP